MHSLSYSTILTTWGVELWGNVYCFLWSTLQGPQWVMRAGLNTSPGYSTRAAVVSLWKTACPVPVLCLSIRLPSFLQEQLHSQSQELPEENQMNDWKDLWLLEKEVAFKNTELLSSSTLWIQSVVQPLAVQDTPARQTHHYFLHNSQVKKLLHRWRSWSFNLGEYQRRI